LSAVGAAYAAAASAWANGPAAIYRRLAQLLVDFSPVPLQGRLVLDLGSGTGVGSHAAQSAGARVIATDLALGMLLRGLADRPPAAAGDALALPFRPGSFDVVLAAFSLNHLEEPAAGVREAGRVGGLLLASTYAADDDHPAKAAVDTAMSEAGWEQPPWYEALKPAMAAWGSVERATEVVERGGMRPRLVEQRQVEFPELGPDDMVAWRMGLAQSAGFVEALEPEAQRAIFHRALALLGHDPEPIVRRVIFLAATADTLQRGRAVRLNDPAPSVRAW
jgi:SAM-dependent methyltransferase